MLALHTIPMLMIYFNYHRLIKMVANFLKILSHGLMTKFITKTHLYRYHIISCIAFSNVLAISVTLILTAVPLAVLSLIFSIFALNCYDGYTNLIHHIITFRKILLETVLSPAHHHISKQRFQCYQEAGVICSYFILICYSSFFPRFLF